MEGMLRLAEYAVEVFRSMNLLYDSLRCFPGVYEYEVTAELGEWIARQVFERGCDPRTAMFREELRRLEYEFCKRGGVPWPDAS